MNLSFLLLISCILNGLVLGYPGGASSASCVDMLPLHSGTSPSNEPSPFEIVLSQNEILSNETLQVTIRQTSEAHDFKGFLVMGFNNANQEVTGQFSVSSDYKLLPCSSLTNSAATHKNATLKKSFTLLWNPPVNFDGAIIFKATVLKTVDTYWAKQPSTTLRVIASGEAPTTSMPPVSTTSITPQVPDVYNGCGSSKGCLVVPEANCLKTLSCTTIFTHSKLNESMLEMEMYARSGKSRYFAVGFSSDTDMGDDSVVECLVDNENLGAFMSFNYPKKFNERVDLVNGFSVVSSSYVDGYIYCKIRFPVNHKVNDVDFDLNEPHHVLFAYGPSQSSYIDVHDSVQTTNNKVALTVDVSISSVSKSNRVLKQLHGSFMVIAWLIAGSIAVVMPRYFRKTWVGVKYQGKDMWFVYHQGLMITTWVLTMLGFILIFIDVGGWVSESVSENPHPLIGCITTALAFIQPIMAYFRPGPNTPRRPMFNWAHSIVGYSTHILALTCIFLAVEMEEAELPFYTYWFLTAHVCCYVGAQITLAYLAQKNASIDEQSTKTSLDEPGSGKRKLTLMCLVVTSVGLSSIIIGFIINQD